MPTPETLRQLLAAYEACESKKGEDTRILSLDPADSGLADFFLITSASNDRQVVAIADEIEFSLKQNFGLYATSVEGRRQGEWILLDYTDIVIHVFLAEKRAFYDIERLRKSARNLTGADVEAELKAALAEKTRAVRSTKPTPTKTAKGDSTVSAKKAVKKAVKPAAKKAASKPAAKKVAAKKAPAKAPAKKAVATKKPTPGKASVAAPKAPAKKAVAKKAAVKTPVSKGVVAPVAAAVAPAAIATGRGAKPPIIKVQPRLPNPIALAAAAEAPAAPAKKKK